MDERKRKPKCLLGRGRAALRAVLLAVAAIAMLNLFFHTAFLFPWQAVRAEARAKGLYGAVDILLCEREAPIGWTARKYLVTNGNAVAFYIVKLTASGWEARGDVLDCSGGEMLYAETFGVSYADRARGAFLFGCVSDPAADTLCYRELREEETAWRETSVRLKDCIAYGERRYFLLRVSSVMQTVERQLGALDRQGNTLAHILDP